jgi:uncharacterized protein YbaR (Trm112 family)
MKKKYFCPHCKAQLNFGNDIILLARKKNKETGLILASQEVGDYSVTKDPLFKMEKGEHIEIMCPVCHKRLQVGNIHENLAMLMMKDEQGVESEIYFSEIFGEHCTYKITNIKKVETFGEDFEKYTFWKHLHNYF